MHRNGGIKILAIMILERSIKIFVASCIYRGHAWKKSSKHTIVRCKDIKKEGDSKYVCKLRYSYDEAIIRRTAQPQNCSLAIFRLHQGPHHQ